MPLIMNHPRKPPAGFPFTDPTGYMFVEQGLAELIKAIATYRANNGFTPGNPAAEVELAYAKDYPWLISKVGLVGTKGIDHEARWIERAWRTKLEKFVATDPAENRLSICLSCPHYRPDRRYSTDAFRRISVIGKGKYKDVGACAAHHWAVGLAIWVENIETAKPEEGCWAT